jgi:hypothetical protein
MITEANGSDMRAEQVVCLLRDLAERCAKGKGVDSDDARRQLRAINHAARQVLLAKRIASGSKPETDVPVNCCNGGSP